MVTTFFLAKLKKVSVIVLNMRNLELVKSYCKAVMSMCDYNYLKSMIFIN